jgi:hypothetical protein
MKVKDEMENFLREGMVLRRNDMNTTLAKVMSLVVFLLFIGLVCESHQPEKE